MMDLKTVLLNKKIITLFVLFIIMIISSQNLKWVGQSIEKKIINVPTGNCHAQKQLCTVTSDDFKIGISFDKNIYYLKKFNVSVWTENKESADIESIQIDFKMKNMNMGVNRFMLEKINSENKRQQWQGKALLPICVTGRADWFAELEVVTKQSKFILTLPLFVQRSSN
jgi:hypothetical protein